MHVSIARFLSSLATLLLAGGKPAWMTGLAFVACAAGLPAAANAQSDLRRHEQIQTSMGTTFRIVLYGSDAPAATRAMEAAFQRIHQLDEIMSDYSETSELSKLCERAGGPPVPVSDDLFRVLVASAEFARQSGGAFDVTAGPVVRLWRKARRTKKLPSESLIGDAMAKVGNEKMLLDTANKTVQLKIEEMKLDLGGIAKGFACDEAMKVIRTHGIDRAMVVGGGDIVVGASPPGQAGWKVAIGPSLKPESDDAPVLVLQNQAVSTSGDSAQFAIIKNRRYSHIVDPRTGKALSERRRVTVVAPTGSQSDAMATAVSVMGVERGIPFVDATPGTAALIANVGTRVELHSSKQWPRIAQFDASRPGDAAKPQLPH